MFTYSLCCRAIMHSILTLTHILILLCNPNSLMQNSQYRCRLIQKALDTLSMEDVASIVSCIKGKVWDLVHDHNGNHVIQKSVTKLNEYLHEAQGREGSATQASLLNSLDVIIDEVTASMKDLSVHPYGCRVVQRLIEYCTESQKATVLDCIAEEGLFQTLITHEYGNYVVQRVLAYGRPADKDVVFDTISSRIMELSKQKHSSNVVEMMLTYGTKMQQEHIIAEILRVSIDILPYCMCVILLD